MSVNPIQSSRSKGKKNQKRKVGRILYRRDLTNDEVVRLLDEVGVERVQQLLSQTAYCTLAQLDLLALS